MPKVRRRPMIRAVIRHMAGELVKMCGIRNLILLLLLGLILSYLFSHDKCFDVVMDFLIMTIPVDVPSNMASPTRVEDELDFGEWENKIKKLARRRVENKTIYVPSVNCHWRVDGIDLYANDYFYMRIKYVLYYEGYCFIRNSGTKYNMQLVDIMAGVHRKFDILFLYVAGIRIITYFHHNHFDLFARSSRLNSVLYEEVYLETNCCELSMRRIVNYSGVLVSPSLICRLRKDRLNVA
jgi:hypothetical protein